MLALVFCMGQFMKSSIKLIAFDLFGVIISEGHMVSNVLMPLLGNNYHKQQVKSFYHQYTLGEIEEQEFWNGIGFHTIPPVREQFLDAFELDADVEKVTGELSKRYQLAILSNLAADWGLYLSDKFKFAQTYSPKIISGEVCCGKPDRNIYQALIKSCDYEPGKIAFIDDRLENLVVAHDLGMTTIHYCREVDKHAYQADFTITKLSQLLNYF